MSQYGTCKALNLIINVPKIGLHSQPYKYLFSRNFLTSKYYTHKTSISVLLKNNVIDYKHNEIMLVHVRPYRRVVSGEIRDEMLNQITNQVMMHYLLTNELFPE